jgi:hypothetical protein
VAKVLSALRVHGFTFADRILPGLTEFNVREDEWKLMTVSIGANDVVSTFVVRPGSSLPYR